jgi:type II pantothenate kinase
MNPFVHLESAATYVPGLWDLSRDAEARATWRQRLLENARDLVALVAAEGEDARRRVEGVHRTWTAILDRLDDPEVARAHPTVLDLVTVRDRLLLEHGIADAYGVIKRRENARCLDMPIDVLLPRSAGDSSDGVGAACAAVLAGNVFDMASPLVAEAYERGPERVIDLAREVQARPPAIDHRPALRSVLETRSQDPAVLILVDNAGLDFLQGVMPLTRSLVEIGCHVTLGANETPSLNDVTAREAVELVERVAAKEPVLRGAVDAGRLVVVSTGGRSSGIDLRNVSTGLNQAASTAALLVIVGQGRAVETTWNARLSIPTLRLATIKSRLVAARLGLTPLDSLIELRAAGEAPSLTVR